MIMEIYIFVRLIIERGGEKEVKKEGSGGVWRDESSSSKREERSPRKSVKESR